MLAEAFAKICALQPAYSSVNTPEMRERGRLIRRVIPDVLKSMKVEFENRLGPFGLEFNVDASDGIGRKTEAPWVRIFATGMSPTAREGFYVVVHFAANGSAVFITVGCGSTIWANGSLSPISDAELSDRTAWARSIVNESFGSLSPFEDQIILGAKAPLPRTFEKATAFAHRIPVRDLDDNHIEGLLYSAAERLQAIYEAQRLGRDRAASTNAEIAIEQVVDPSRTSAAGQGFGLSAAEKLQVEKRAMWLAQIWLEGEGYVVKDVSATSSFDLEATKEGRSLKIEVKGTTNDVADAILMTYREVELHRREKGATGLIIASGIRLRRKGERPTADGGKVQVELGWDIDTWLAAPIAYKLTRPTITLSS